MDEVEVPDGFQLVVNPWVPLKYQAKRYMGDRLNVEARTPNLSGLATFPQDRLWRISCEYQPVTDASLDLIVHHHSIEELVLSRTRVTDAGMHTLVKLDHLRSLTLAHCAITDVGLATIAAIDSLDELVLYGTQVSGAGLRSLLRHPSLLVLDVRNTQVRDGLEPLATIPHLRELRLSWWAERRSAELRRLRPDVVII